MIGKAVFLNFYVRKALFFPKFDVVRWMFADVIDEGFRIGANLIQIFIKGRVGEEQSRCAFLAVELS